ncbi:magnesium-translocating P-type ATPase [Iodobacter fluviatilis]|uniref:Magnesium-transporting ATPase, P-type 1 n=1 Tax=Iodobacter fluviatilis TaxID=537 RepID=A0A377Q8F3_9NEIS|nr:magnesium-translocating P-type ATPase [Iodobacter fluviatilis]TCU88736.1 Mg2+-importing ATPase [Iodobacter fluviatilis]STQ91193.1 Magnesium-transporting ATPase, P-type 1 [Iodobacter fluviatilis]
MRLFKNRLLNFIQKGLSARQFRRSASLEQLRGMNNGREMSKSLGQRLLTLSKLEISTALHRLGSCAEGLSHAEADNKRLQTGPNEIEHEKPISWIEHLWLCYRNPFNILLTLLAVISFVTEDATAAAIISAMVVISAFLRFVQEKRSNTAADRLKAMVSNTATVLRRDPAKVAAAEAEKYFGVQLHPRPAGQIELPIRQLVPGDIVVLSAGDMIPADLRLFAAKDLFISQAALTGESMPVEKFAWHKDASISNPLERDNLCFMGTNVVSGAATAVVIGTGNQTYFGSLAERVSASDRTLTQFQLGVNKISWLLIRFMFVMAPLVLFINGFTKGDWPEAALFALSIAVGLTPEMLPMIVTAALAKGAVILSRKKVVVKRLDAIQNFGAMDILCTDKTGTLTQDKIVLERHTDVFGCASDEVLSMAYLNSYYQTGLKNLLDVAVLEHAHLNTELGVAQNYRKVDEIPFDFNRRRMSVVVSEQEDHHELICKGALEEVLAVCSHVRHGTQIEPLSAGLLHDIRNITAALNQDGLRVVAVASKEMPSDREAYGVSDESDLVLVGYIAFLDPPKESTAPAIKALKANGVSVKVLTGDNDLVTLKICKEVGLQVDGVLLGSQIETMDDPLLANMAETTTVFAKLTPLHKERIVRLLRGNGHVVGFMGDGINDAPALRAADIGISVDSAVDIAKEAADIILLEKSLMVLEEGVIEGRKTFANMLKYIKMTASSNFGNVFSVLIASAFIPFLPMLPLHLLIQNLLYDISQTTIPFDHVDKESLSKPQKWNPDELGRFMIFFGPISSIFDITTFAVLWYVFKANTESAQTLFQSGWFIEGLLSQTLVVHLLRTRKLPFIQSRAAWPLLAMTALIMAIGILLPMGPWAHYFKLQALPLAYFPCLIAILLGYITLTQIMKGIYARRYGWQ